MTDGALRSAGAGPLWARDMVAHGRPDITADEMRTAPHADVDSALRRLGTGSAPDTG